MQVLLIEDNPDDALIISRYAAKDGAITLTHRDTLDDGLAHIAEQPVDVLLLDLALPDGFGLAIYDAVMARFPTLPVIILSGSINDTIALDAVRHGAQDYLVKGSVNEHILAHALRYAVERKRIENELAAERNLLRTVLDSSPDYIYTKDLQGNYVTVNRAILDGRGLESVDQMAGLNAFDITPPELAQAIEEDERKILSTGEPLINREEMHTLPETGQTLWLLTTKVPLRDHNRQITGLLAISRDITERKLLEAQLMQERDQLRSLIDGIPDYIFIKDAKGRFVVSNIAHAKAANTTPDELVGKTAFDVFPPEFAAQYHADDERVMRSGEPLVNVERQSTRSDGSTKTVLTTKIPLRDKAGRITGLVGISRDITSRKLVETKERELAAERERIHVLQRFITDLSHDLRTPLSIISSSVYLMQRNPEKRKAHGQSVEQQLLRLDKLLSNVLQMAHLDQQIVVMQFARVDLNAYLNPIISDYGEVAAVKHISLSIAPESETCFARIDEVEFASALISLLENAVAYTLDGGHVTVRTRCEGDEIIVAIEDSGIGIAEQDLAHIFGRFYRADTARSTNTGGHGLGLPIAQRVVEAHGGRITVESILDEGSTFSIHLPASPSE